MSILQHIPDFEVVFPREAGGMKVSRLQRYYRVYYGFVRESLKAAGARITLSRDSHIGDARFTIGINGHTVAIDYSDHLTLAPPHAQYEHYFKFHCSHGEHEQLPHVLPFSPISFYNWGQFDTLRQQIRYTAQSDRIVNRQHPHGNALHRRRHVQHLLQHAYRKQVATRKVEMTEFWHEVNDCLVSVCVPGFRNNMLDRGQLQYMAFGACTISPRLINYLPCAPEKRLPNQPGQLLIPGQHYIACADDYSDLIEKIEWCRENRDECVAIGQRAQQLFLEHCTPYQLWQWVLNTISSHTTSQAS